MKILMIPAPGPGPTSVRVEENQMIVNGTSYALGNLPETGPVRLVGEIVLVEYGKDGALSSCQIGERHEVRFVAVTEPVPVPEAEPLPEPLPQAPAETSPEVLAETPPEG